VSDDDLYDGVVTVMMRVVFLLFAEERRLLPSDDDVYVAAYSVSRLVEQLQRAEALMLAAAPVVPLYYHTHVFLVQPSVKGWHPTLLDHHPYKHVWLEK